jgi:D-aminopeptidase
MKLISFIVLFLVSHPAIYGQKPRARDLGIPFEGKPGKFNAITDVKELK